MWSTILRSLGLFLLVGNVQLLRISVLPFVPSGSHFRSLHKLATELESRGHQVVFVIADSYPDASGKTFPHTIYKAGVQQSVIELFKKLPKLDQSLALYLALLNVLELAERHCNGIMNDERALLSIRNSDILIAEDMVLSAPLIAEVTHVPLVTIAANIHGLLSKYHETSMPLFKGHFFRRIADVMIHATHHVLFSKFLSEMEKLQKKFSISPSKDYLELARKPLAVIIQADFAVEFVHSLPAYVHLVGPIMPQPAKPLSTELEDFMKSAGEKGVVVVSFGTYAIDEEKKSWEEMVKALKSINQKVVWKTSLNFSGLGDNIKQVKWLPQNDLLGHPQTKAFISHVGHSSAYEAAYHGVPVVAVPLFLEQPQNAVRLEQKAKMAKTINFRTATEKEWKDTIESVIESPWFKGNATRVSKLLRNQSMTAVHRAALIIEQLEKNGFDSSHLHSASVEKSYIAYYSMDIFTLLGCVVILTVWLLFQLLRTVSRTLTSKPRKSKVA